MIAGNLTGLAGYAKQVSKISMIEAITNIVLSVILVNRFGIAGVLFATVIALPLKLVYCNWLADKVILKRSPFKTIRILAVNIGLFLVLVFIRNQINIEISSYGMFVKYGILFTVCSVLLFSVANVLANRKIYTTLKTIMRRFNARKAG
jgi:O-antigen/teichoic acid export membrane protein